MSDPAAFVPDSGDKQPKYAPARADGEKPWVVTVYRWGTTTDRLVYAEDKPTARYRAVGRAGVAIYVSRIRRATPSDIEALS